MKLLIAAGGTGGHIFPGVAVAEAFLENKAHEVVFTGTSYGMEERIIPSLGFRLVKIEARPFLGGSPLAKVRTLLTLMRGVVQARRVIQKEKPDAILGMGGFTSVPVLLAGLYGRVPCFIHEQNVYPGMANRWLSRRVRATFISFKETTEYLKARAVVHTGNPVRKAMRGKRAEKSDGNFNIFVFGGSRGARAINEGVLALLPYLESRNGIGIYHQTGTEDLARVAAAYERSPIVHEVFPFTDEMEKYYNLADVVISRAGASTIFELSYFGKPAILIPYPFSAGGHQWKNGAAVERVGGARLIDNSEVSGQKLYAVITELLENPEKLAHMRESIRSIYVEDAERKVIREIEACVSQN
jgi:UDP-N-acetylglucosamine--N-acetylmuramyl-(pentapeptide) pyrophosphoryl-undecaprenol N-acetylglucosamine transferase